jgi:tRNA A-37 threonylcarbamoyl transferase component Bud32
MVPGLTNLRVLARGGYATVFRAVQESVGREVAVKIENHTLENERDRRRFLREARAAGRMSSHPHVVDLFDAGVTTEGHPYLIMELCRGSYFERMKTVPLSPAEARDVGVKIADALADAHSLGVLHRDVKPANILISDFGEPALADFGLATLAEARDVSITLDVLTPAYAPPEMFQHAQPTPAVDVYALCATLYALMAGRPPRWPGTRDPSLMSIVDMFADPLPTLDNVPRPLMLLLERGMSNASSDRPTAVELRDALLALELGALPVASVAPGSLPTRPASSVDDAVRQDAAMAGAARLDAARGAAPTVVARSGPDGSVGPGGHGAGGPGHGAAGGAVGFAGQGPGPGDGYGPGDHGYGGRHGPGGSGPGGYGPADGNPGDPGRAPGGSGGYGGPTRAEPGGYGPGGPVVHGPGGPVVHGPGGPVVHGPGGPGYGTGGPGGPPAGHRSGGHNAPAMTGTQRTISLVGFVVAVFGVLALAVGAIAYSGVNPTVDTTFVPASASTAPSAPKCPLTPAGEAQCVTTPECYDAISVTGGIARTKLVACTEPHGWEVFARGTFAGAVTTNFDKAKQDAAVKRICTAANLALLDTDPGWRIEVLPPTQEQATAGEKTFRCVAGKAPAKSTGSKFTP